MEAWERVEEERYQSNEVGGTGRICKSSIAVAAREVDETQEEGLVHSRSD